MKKNLFLALAILFFAIVLAIDVISDLNLLESNGVNHTRGLLIRTIGLLPALVMFCLYKRNFKWVIITSIIMMGFNYLNLFDGFYNLFRDHQWFFTGSEDGAADAKTDNFFQSIPLWAHAAIKIGGSIISILIYLFTFKNKRK